MSTDQSAVACGLASTHACMEVPGCLTAARLRCRPRPTALPAPAHCRSLFAPTWLFVAATAWPFNSDICCTAPLSNPAARAATAAIYKPLR